MADNPVPTTFTPTLANPATRVLITPAPAFANPDTPAPIICAPAFPKSVTLVSLVLVTALVSITLVTLVPVTLAPELVISPNLFKRPLILSPDDFIRVSKSFITNVRSSPVLLSRKTNNSAILVDCHVLNKLFSISWQALHPSSRTSLSSYEILPWRKRVLRTKVNSLGFMGRFTCVDNSPFVGISTEPAGAGWDCDRLQTDGLVLVLLFHQKINPFWRRSSSICAVMVSSSRGEILPPSSLQRITTIFFAVTKRKRCLVFPLLGVGALAG